MTRVLVIHPGTQHSFELATELNRLDALASLHTSFVIGQGGIWERLIDLPGFPLRHALSKRLAPRLPASKTHLQIGLELASYMLQALGNSGQAHFHWRNEVFQRAVPDRAFADADVVIGFDTSSWILTERCRTLGKPLIMVQTIGHPDAMEAVNELIAAQFPDWQPTFERRLPKVREAEQIEFDETTLIVGSSRFTRDTLVAHGVSPNKIRVIPHGVDSARFSVKPRKERPFRFIFVGSISGRKGIPLLLDAWRRLAPTDAELWLVGPISAEVRPLLPNLPGLRIWGAVPNNRVAHMMQQCDVLVFPSYFEGFGLVILQAMACGLPVISTMATAAPDLISAPGAGGWVLPTGELEALEHAMAHCLAHRDEVPEIGKQARSIAERHSWQAYGRNWLPVLEEAISRPPLSTTPSSIRQKTAIRRGQRVLIAHPGTQYSFQLAKELRLRDRLARFHTGFAIRKGSMGDWLCHALPISARRRFATRMLDGMPGDKLQLHPILEGRSLIRQRLSSLGTEENLHRRNEAFQREISDNELGSADVVIGFDTSSWLLSRRVKRMNGKFILDQSIGHPIEKERIFNSLRDRYPQWMTTIPRKADTHIAEEIEEQKLADLIVVPSSFVRSTLTSQGIPHAKIRVIPFGTDLDFFRPDEASRPADPVIFLFVGSISARKGVPVLLEAWRHIRVSNAELWLVGPGPIPSGEASQLPSSIRFLGRKSRPEVAKLMRLAHALVFPSFFEGLAQVQIEALASGLPVISTREAGAEDVIRDGENGFLVPAGDVTALSERVQELATNRDLLHAMQRTVVAERDRLSWSIYGDRWVKVLDELA